MGDEKQKGKRDTVVINPAIRGGRPVIRGMRITVGDVNGWLASGMSEAEISKDYPVLTEADIRAALAFTPGFNKKDSLLILLA